MNLLTNLIQNTNIQPRPYQERIVTKTIDLFINKNLRSILIESPTGSGKTVMGLLTAKFLQQELGLRIGWVAMRRNLLAQAAEENRNKNINVECAFISMFDKNPPTEPEVLIVDEAQHDAANSMANLHQVIQPRFILGLSATPFRSDRIKLCFDTVIKDAGIHTLIQDGYLSPYHHYTIPTYTPSSVAEFYCRTPEKWGKSLFYFHTLDECFHAGSLLRAAGIRADVVTANSEREEQLEAFRNGELDVLCNCMVLSEGFDCPELRTVFCRPSCKGVTVQMAGRVLRKHPEMPFKQIVQCRRTEWPFQRTATAAQQWMWEDDKWRSLEMNEEIQRVSGQTLRTLAKINVELPKILTGQSSARRRTRQRTQTAE